jgi:phosphatidylserine/phosphatidylglycerophosphate/cardiolipin synthase-like enzyme
MTNFENAVDKDGFALKLWRGESMCLVGMDVPSPEDDFVGFSIEVKSPDSNKFMPLRNRLAFSYSSPNDVNGDKKFPSTEAPFQKFRWVHFPQTPSSGTYEYRVTKQHMPTKNGNLVAGTSHTLGIALDPVTYDGVLDIGFTRNFASSQAFQERYAGHPTFMPAKAEQGLGFTKPISTDIYEWLGFEAHKLLFETLKEAVSDPAITVDALAYDLNEPDIVRLLEQLKSRLRIVVDESTEHKKATSAETAAVARLKVTAGAANVTRTAFKSQQHNKVLIIKRHGAPKRVLVGSTNFSFRGLYIQANNMIVFRSPGVAELFSKYFDAVFAAPLAYVNSPFAGQWHRAAGSTGPEVQICFSPHPDEDLSLNPIRGAIDSATSSVFYAIAFLNQTGGATRKALDRLIAKDLFSYGIVHSRGDLTVAKPDGSMGLVDFAYLSKNAPTPFKEEWAAGNGINIHHKFVVTDFNLPSAKVFTGSSNLSPNAENNNGDHLIMIADRRVATAYAIEVLRVFDHLHFRNRLRAASTASGAKKDPMTLRKPRKIEKKDEPAWFEKYFDATRTQLRRDRELFAGRT